jgi:hypothetical protein
LSEFVHVVVVVVVIGGKDADRRLFCESWIGTKADVKRKEAMLEGLEVYDRVFQTRKVKRKSSNNVSATPSYDEVLVPEELPVILDSVVIERMERLQREQQLKVEAAVIKLKEVTNYGVELKEKLSLEGDRSLHKLEDIAFLVEENERLKACEKEFKLTCRKERQRLSEKIKDMDLEKEAQEEDLAIIDEANEQIQLRLSRARVKLASISRAQASESRFEDAEPTKVELLQFERRFAELYEQMTLKSDEHRRHVTTFNSLSTKVSLIEGQLSLLKSIRDGFIASKSNPRAASELLSQFPTILEGFNNSIEKSKMKLANAEKNRGEADQELQILLAKQRKYYRAMRDLHESFLEHERLLALRKNKNKS